MPACCNTRNGHKIGIAIDDYSSNSIHSGIFKLSGLEMWSNRMSRDNHKKLFGITAEQAVQNDDEDNRLPERQFTIKFTPEKPNPRGRPKKSALAQYRNGKYVPLYKRNKNALAPNKCDVKALNEKDMLRGAE